MGDSSDLAVCPYDKSHRMLPGRLASHILKCRVNHPDSDLRKCPFNQTHLIPEAEFSLHLSKCPNKAIMLQYKYDAPDSEQQVVNVQQKSVQSNEDWDYIFAQDYEPQRYAQKAPVIREPAGITPSERRKFRDEEDRRLTRMLATKNQKIKEEVCEEKPSSSKLYSSELQIKEEISEEEEQSSSKLYSRKRKLSDDFGESSKMYSRESKTKEDAYRQDKAYRDHSPMEKSSKRSVDSRYYSRRSSSPPREPCNWHDNYY